MEIKKAMVVGCGQMGHGIAQICATGGADGPSFPVPTP